MGKSRLCTELATRADTIGATVMEGSCSEADLALPYLPFLEAIGNHLSSGESAKLRERLGVHARELGKVFPQLAEEGPTATETDTPDRRLRLFEAFLALLGLASEERGLLLIVEDLHWADASTRELLDYMTRRLRNRRILVLATYRRDEMHRKHPLLPTIQGWQRSRLAQLVELEPLSRVEVARMVSSILDDTHVGEEFRDFFHARTEGNPFVLEEMLKSAIDRGDVYRDESDWQRKPISELRIPETVRDTILLRVERLDRSQAAILQCAAVLGRSFDYQTLIRVSEQDRLAVETTLQTAVQQQLLEEESGSRHRYRFRHALTQEAIYEDLSAPTRERLHSTTADVLAEVPETSKAEIGLHLRNANRWQEAIKVTMDAAAAAEAGLGYGEAAALYSLLLPVVTTGIDRALLLCRLGDAYALNALPGRAIDPLEKGISLLEELGQPLEAARYRLTLGRSYWERRDSRRALAEYERAREVLEPAGPSRDLAFAYIRLAGMHIFNYEGAAAQELAKKAIQIGTDARAADMRIWAYNFVGLAIAQQGDYPTGIEYLERSADQALERGFFYIAGNALHNLVSTYVNNLEPDKVHDAAQRLAAIKMERFGVVSSLMAMMIWGHVTGRVEAGAKTARELAARARAMDDATAEHLALAGLCHNCIELGRVDEARAHLSRPSAESDVQALVGDAWTWIEFHLATGDQVGALEGADLLLGLADPGVSAEAGEVAIEALVEAGRLDDAGRIQAALENGPSPSHKLAASLGRARIRLASSEATRSADEVRDAVARLQAAGLVPRELWARLLLAKVHQHDGDPAAAEAEYRQVLNASRSHGLRLLERRAGEGLAALGIVVDAPSAPAAPHREEPSEIGERLVTVMFADVRGYTAMTGTKPPAEMVDLVATYQRWAAQEVERHFGTVDKFAGDAVMATFNVSGNQVDHAAHSVKAALALRDKAAMLGLPVGIGIATGSAVVGALKTGANVSVVGETTNLASRLQAQAAAGEVMLSDETYRRLVDTVEATPVQLELKGIARPVTAYRVGSASL
jgi:class 3 adenylate cyclase